MAATATDAQNVITSKNISKYSVGQPLADGYLVRITPNVAGESDGPGQLEIGDELSALRAALDLEKSTSAVDQTLLATRRTVREEMATLRQLKTDYEKLQEEKAQGRKSGLLGAAVLLAGLGALSTGLTDLLRVATGASGGDVATQGAVEVVFGLVGVYIYQSRQ